MNTTTMEPTTRSEPRLGISKQTTTSAAVKVVPLHSLDDLIWKGGMVSGEYEGIALAAPVRYGGYDLDRFEIRGGLADPGYSNGLLLIDMLRQTPQDCRPIYQHER